jgi:outer membrane receptor protein involved in Fe transport
VFPVDSHTDAAAWYSALHQRVFQEEVRLTSLDPNATFTWVAGTLFSSEHARGPDRFVAAGVPDAIDATVTDQTELAAFGQIALRVTKRLTASAGLRIGHSSYDSRYDSIPASPPFHAAAADTWMTPRFVLSHQVDAHNLLYLTAAKGYGSAGVYPGPPLVPYPPETLWSYEIGSKNDVLHRRVHLDASVFHIHWDNGPPNFSFANNENEPVPGTADSNGFDLAVQAEITERVRMGLGIAYTDARFTQTLTVKGGVLVRKGDTVGGAPWSVTASLERDFTLRRGVTGSVRAENVFHSRNPGPYFADNPAAGLFYSSNHPDPSTNVLNLRADLKWSSFELAAIVSNVLDSRPILGIAQPLGGALNGVPTAQTLTPRTLNVSGTWRF